MSIDLSMYGRMLGGKTLGRVRKEQSDMVMEQTWDGDIQSQIAYCYDYYHDIGSERFMMRDLHPYDDLNKIPVDVKFIRHESQSLNKDQVTFWLQFKPGQECVLDYYASALGNKYGATWPVGVYFDIQAEDGKYNKWLCVNTANYWGNQFPTYQLLPVDYLLQWIHKGKKYECPVVLASQNSYNSGLWLDFKVQSVEDQQKIIAPMNEVTETLWYNKRILIDTALYGEDSECRAWLVSKINRIAPRGICNVTTAQDRFDQHHDFIEKDEDGNIIGMWADWFKDGVEPTPVEASDAPDSLFTSIISKVTTNTAQIRVGGTRTFTVTFYDEDEAIDHETGEWSFSIDGEDVSELLTISYPSDNKVKVKFNGDDNYIGKVLTITNTFDEIVSSIDVAIIAF